MKLSIQVCILFLLTLPMTLFAQSDEFSGTWEMKYQAEKTDPVIECRLEIAAPDKNLLYPARMILQTQGFSACYEFLLVKKNLRQLGISKNKFPRSETPFSLYSLPVVLNGTLNFMRDLKGIPHLTLNRLLAKKYGLPLPEFKDLDEKKKFTANRLTEFIKNAPITLKKINGLPWQDPEAENILIPGLSPDYFGLQDTIFVPTRDGSIQFSGNKKSGNDIITVVQNGVTIIDQLEVGRKKDNDEILLDTGLNIITLFADNFNKSMPNKAKLLLVFGRKKIKLDFTNSPDYASTFITLRLYFEKDKDADTRFSYYHQPPENDTALTRSGKLIGSIIASSSQITLALWDDAVEDGDSVSIRINGKWITRGFPVKKIPQFIPVTLDPGPNTITFVADNLGSIPPNTSVLEIIDGKKRKSFNIETDLNQDNMIKIYYDYQPVK